MDIKTTLKASVAAAALFAFAAPVATTANADESLKSGNKNSLTMSGQISRALYWADDGPHSGLFNTAGESATSRIRWIAGATVNESVTVGGLIEMEIPHSSDDSNAKFSSATGANQGDETFGDQNTWALRQEHIWIKHKTMGKLSLGKTSEPTDGGWRANFAKNGGTGANYSHEAFGGSIEFMIGNSFTGITAGATRSDLSPGTKQSLIRYDLPTLPGGAKIGVSLGANGATAVNGSISGKAGAFSTKAGIGYKNLSSSSTSEYGLAASLGALHSSGIHASIGVAQQPIKTLTATAGNKSHVGGNVGTNAKIFAAGATGFAFGYGRSLNAGARGQVGETFAFTAAQYFDSIGASVTLVYRNHQYENERISHTGISDIDLLGIHTVFKF